MNQPYFWEQDENEIGIYLPGGEGYFRYALRHIVKPFTDGGIHQNQDLWRLHKAYLCRKTPTGFEHIYDFPLTTGGEWECAVRIKGTPDFHGGFHGYEHLTDFHFEPKEDSFEAVQESRIVLQGTRSEPVARHRKEYSFRGDTLTVRQELVWERAVEIDRAFMTMLPIRRREEDFLISDTAIFDGVEYDVSMDGHKTPISSGSRFKGTTITVKGKESGISAVVTVDRDTRVSVQNTPPYNKIYFRYASDSSVQVGDVWSVVTTYQLSYHDPKKA